MIDNWIIKYSIAHLFHRKLRTMLTILAIAIGILTITLLIGIGQGVNEEVKNQLSIFGPRNFIIAPFASISFSSGGAPKIFFTDKELKAIKASSYVEKAEPSRSSTLVVIYKDEKQVSRIIGANYEYVAMLPAIKIDSGRLYSKNERGVVIIGNKVANELFEHPIRVNSKLIINGKSFKVVGVLKVSGSSMAPIDNIIFIPLDDMKIILGDSNYSAISGVFKEGVDIKEASSNLEDILIRVRKVLPDNKDFSIVTSESIIDTFNKIMNALNAFLGGAGAISIIVASVGVANTMFASVLERTREIGTIKAIGGTNDIIYKIIVFESALIGIVGGAIGVVISYLIAYTLSFFSVPVIISLPVAIFSILLSTIVAIIAGLIPARNAANIAPTEALRYE